MNTKLSLLAGAALAVFGFAGAANASTFTQTVTFGPAVTDYNGTGPGAGSILLFDSNGGTLNSITFTSSYGFSSTITVSNGAQANSGGNVDTESAAQFGAGTAAATAVLNSRVNTDGTAFIGSGSLSPVAYDVVGNKSGYNLASGSTANETSTGTTQSNPMVTDTTASDLAAFAAAGGGNLAIDFVTLTGTNLSNTGGNTSASQSTTATGSITISYNYTAAPPVTPPANPVPEPASMLVLGSGLVGLGLARRRRRQG